jgi:hypothetical protein
LPAFSKRSAGLASAREDIQPPFQRVAPLPAGLDPGIDPGIDPGRDADGDGDGDDTDYEEASDAEILALAEKTNDYPATRSNDSLFKVEYSDNVQIIE